MQLNIHAFLSFWFFHSTHGCSFKKVVFEFCIGHSFRRADALSCLGGYLLSCLGGYIGSTACGWWPSLEISLSSSLCAFFHHSYCRDQRITQDVDKFCDQVTQVLPKIILSPGIITYYTYKTFQRCSGQGDEIYRLRVHVLAEYLCVCVCVCERVCVRV